MKHTSKCLFSVLLVLCLVLSLTVLTVGAEDKTLTSVYASYAAEGHTNEPLADDVYEVAGDSVTVSIMTTTDMHGRAYDWNSYTNSALSNNYLQAAKLIADRRALVDDSIVIDNGDILQGSALSSYNVMKETGKNSPMAIALRYIGYDAFGLGNHEFNFGPEQQWNFYNMLESTDPSLPGTPVSVLCANVVESETKESVFSPYKTFTYQFSDGTTYTIGLLMFENMNNANWDVASHYEGCTFGHPDNTEHSYVWEYERYAEELAAKCDYLIVAVHSGEGSSTNFNQENQGAYLVANTTGIDMLITGHNHQANASTLKNKDGEDVLVMNGGGSVLAETVLTLTKGADGKVTVSSTEPTKTALASALGTNASGKYNTVPSADFTLGNEAYDGLKALLKESFEKADAFVNAEIGTVSGDWDNKNNYYVEQSDSYDLVHRAQIWAACTDNDIDPTKEHVVSMTSPVANWNWKVADLFTEEGQTSASISLRDCYSLYRYDNNTLFMIKITGEKLMNWMQHTVQNYKVNTDGSISGGGFGCDQFYGINYDVYMGNAAGRQVENVTYADGTPVQADDEIYLCLSSYRLSANEGADAYGWYAATGITSSSEEVVWDATVSERFNTVGGSCPLIIGEYIKALTAEGKDVTPEEPETTWTVHAEASPVVDFEFLVTSDIHGKIFATDYSSGYEASGTYRQGLTRIASYIKEQKALYGDNVYTVDMGDSIQGEPLSYYYAFNADKLDDVDPTIRAFRSIGYDMWLLGNHEFNYGINILNRQMKEAVAPATETENQLVIVDANYLDADAKAADKDSWKTYGDIVPYVIKDFDGVKVAIIGLSTPNIPKWDGPANWKGFYFESIYETYKHYEAEMLEQADLIVVMAHCGIEAEMADASYDSVRYLVEHTNTIDFAFSGHAHGTRVNDIQNSDGETVKVLQPGTKAALISQVKVSYNKETGEFTVDAQNVDMKNYELDEETVALLKPYEEYVWKNYMLQKIGEAGGDFSASNLGTAPSAFVDLVNKVQIWGAYDSTGLNTPDDKTDDKPAMLSITAPLTSGSNANLISKGDIYLGDLFALYRYENWFYQLTMSGKEVRTWLEYSASKLAIKEDGSVEVMGGLTYYDVIGGEGFSYVIDPTRPEGSRVVSMTYNGKEVADDFEFTIVMNNYRFTGGGNYVKYCNEHGCDLSDLEDRIIYSTQYDMIQGEDLGQARALIQAYIEQEKVIYPEITSTWSIQPGYNPFSDVSEDAWYYDYVMAAVEAGLVNGYEDGTFLPEGSLTRAEATTLLYRAAGSPAVEGKASFTDLDRDWYQDAIAWAEQNKVVNGVGKGKFEPEEYVTREQLVTMIWRLEGSKKVEKALEGFEDSAKVNDWAVDAFAWAIEEGIINGTTFSGKTGTYLAPQDNITRAEAAKVFVVYSEK